MRYKAIFTDGKGITNVIISWDKTTRFNKNHFKVILKEGIRHINHGENELNCVVIGCSNSGIYQSTIIINFKIFHADYNDYLDIIINNRFYRTIKY